ncbi:hypothetical protein [Paenibacillus arenilitoris]|uniref:Uncharacterized protein n=1 Tax=Paenibacillus arenilitoris TaxID=2772299 RepID=A0A927CM06_9BACL|nr:hypothetical protein [Paenibacillus arenilitoris]MBD2869048.1 hypothetical protein [Paenibacillus arenilitoris]
MSISIFMLEDSFYETDIQLIPKFDALEAESPDFRFMRLQPKADLTASPDKGVQTADPRHIAKCREALRAARETNADLLVTPEYCVPYALIDELLRDPSLQPPPRKLWCLCCEGASWPEFQEHLSRWGDYACVGRKAIDGIPSANRFACVLLYVFQAQEGGRLCLVPQSKLQPMREERYVCEGAGMTRGNRIIVVGQDSPNRLASVMCADAFHPDVRGSRLLFPEDRERRYILLHPQLNERPRHEELAALRNNLFFEERGGHAVYITANWAAGTKVRLEEQERPVITVRTPWSSLYRRYVSYGGGHWLEELRGHREHNGRHGLGFGFAKRRKLKVWYAHTGEHLQLLLVRKPYGGGPEMSRPGGTVQACRTYVPNETNDGWGEAELPFRSDVPEPLAMEATGDYRLPERSAFGFEAEDRFYGHCLGHDAAEELSLDDGELSARVSRHIDDACESLREGQVERIVSLIRCLKRLRHEGYPSQIRRIPGGFRFAAPPRLPFNLSSKLPYATEGALVAYAADGREMRRIAQRMIDAHGGYWMAERLCVFTTIGGSGEIDHCPKHNDDMTAPFRVEPDADYTQGGISIE